MYKRTHWPTKLHIETGSLLWNGSLTIWGVWYQLGFAWADLVPVRWFLESNHLRFVSHLHHSNTSFMNKKKLLEKCFDLKVRVLLAVITVTLQLQKNLHYRKNSSRHQSSKDSWISDCIFWLHSSICVFSWKTEFIVQWLPRWCYLLILSLLQLTFLFFWSKNSWVFES